MGLKAEFLKKLNVTSASGLFKLNELFYAVADDELFLISFTELSDTQDEKYQLFAGNLPNNPIERKKIKPDFESLMYISSLNALLAIPSGSKKNRFKGALIYLNNGKPSRIQEIDFAGLFEFLANQISELNIEGAIEFYDQIKLFQRGNGKKTQNSILSLRLDIFTEELKLGFITRKSFVEILDIELGLLNEVPLAFTDATVIQTNDKKEILFIAAAENTVSTFDDGEYLGAVVGRLNENWLVDYKEELFCPHKPEGLWAENSKIYVVTDADDPGKASELYRFNIEF